jgi:O-Antigen ligase
MKTNLSSGKRSQKRFLFAAILIALLSYFPAILSYYRIFYFLVAFVFSVTILLVWGGEVGAPMVKKNSRLLILFFVYLAFTSLWAEAPARTLLGTATISIFICVWVLAYVLGSNQGKQEIAQLFVWIPYVVAGTFVYLLARFGALRPYDEGTKVAFGATANLSTEWLVVSLPFLFWLIRRGDRKRYIELGLSFLLLALAQSRTGYFLTILCLLTEIFLRGLSIRRFLTEVSRWAIVLALIIGSAFYFPATRALMQEGFDRTITRESSEEEYLDLERLWMLEQGWESFVDHPILGIGFDNLGGRVEDAYGYEVVSHNILVTLISESGWPGFVIFFLLIYGFFKRTVCARASSRDGSDGFYTACIISMAAALFMGIAYPLLQFPLFYVILAIGYAVQGPANLGKETMTQPVLGTT